MNGLTDIHCHLLPGVDDGAKSMTEALDMARLAYEDGTRTLILTPHRRGTQKSATIQKLQAAFQAFSEELSRQFPDMTLHLGCEAYYASDLPEALSTGQTLTLCNSHYCLLEFNPGVLKSRLLNGISEIIRWGYTPILAHAERYQAFYENKDLVDEVLYMGALIQLNASSILGKQGFRVKWFCARLLKYQQVHFVGSDAHDTKARPPLLQKCYQFICKKYGTEYAAELFSENAQAVIENTLF